MRDNMFVDNNKLQVVAVVAVVDNKLLVAFEKMFVVDDVERNDVEMSDDMELH